LTTSVIGACAASASHVLKRNCWPSSETAQEPQSAARGARRHRVEQVLAIRRETHRLLLGGVPEQHLLFASAIHGDLKQIADLFAAGGVRETAAGGGAHTASKPPAASKVSRRGSLRATSISQISVRPDACAFVADTHFRSGDICTSA
jgi:hypothetical protein